ncbi:cupin domain-containing protein [Mucilaginibacter sp. SP1R1]|uniref:cupin domain-containing protein n=1 Tax=Mucilaginibacter sp. SP1R1 TaxID=2723091 RepID=UPI001621BC2E|nr:cupin domain-containing protein [Mucilaginibacter sp. SP1R1]MBB6149782.1 mannose-6-phosphate isomerase-like protein (cupin superfamily) [Mucilaginibacter sp. SP1R1]
MKSSVIKALQHLSDKPGNSFVKAIQHGSMSVEIYMPANLDPQTPHLQDELYMIINGSGEFINDDIRTSFQQGDVLFVKAGVEHRFENFTDDFATWAVFYGPDGGE